MTQLLDAWSAGNGQALEQLLPLVMGDLRGLARGYMARENPGHTLSPTGLVHEAYLCLVGRRRVDIKSRVQFFAVLAQTMRRILVDHARRKKAARHGGGATPLQLDGLNLPEERSTDLLELDDALQALAAEDPRKAKVVELSYFGGLTFDEIAACMDISPATVKRDLKSAKLWLLLELRGQKN
ncbi:MAG: sigma-70 family RNA polymerase sigma factor [Acidobacteriota bacterium]